MGDLGAGIFEGADGGMMAPDPERRTRSLARMRDLAATSRVPMTFGFVAIRRRRAPARLPRRRRGGRRAGDRADPLPRHLGVVVVQDPRALRSPARVAGVPCPARSRAVAPACAIPATRRSARRRGSRRRLLVVPRRRRASPTARLRRHPRLSTWAAAEPVGRRHRARARRASGRGDDRSRGRDDFEQLFIQPSLYPQDESGVAARACAIRAR